MWRLSGQRARWITAVGRLAPLWLFLTGCAAVPSSQKNLAPLYQNENSTPDQESFAALWERRTVHLGQAREGRNLSPFSIGLSALGGPQAGGAGFPLDIEATLIDSSLLESGFRHYSAVLHMSAQQEEEFRQAYRRRYDPAEHILIWCRLRTTWAELHLNLDRWTIFIEVQDDELRQYEPVEMLEENQAARPAMMDMLPEIGSGPGPVRREVHQKTVMFCFPRQDLLKNPVLSPKVKSLRLVFQENTDEKMKAEGAWVLRK